jgi:hypothetical protein
LNNLLFTVNTLAIVTSSFSTLFAPGYEAAFVCDVNSGYLHTKQTEISQKHSEQTKIFEISYHIISEVLKNDSEWGDENNWYNDMIPITLLPVGNMLKLFLNGRNTTSVKLIKEIARKLHLISSHLISRKFQGKIKEIWMVRCGNTALEQKRFYM